MRKLQCADRCRRHSLPRMETLQNKHISQQTGPRQPKRHGLGGPIRGNGSRCPAPGADRTGKRSSVRRSLWTERRAFGTSLSNPHSFLCAPIEQLLKDPAYQLWVFNPDLRYSNSSPDHSIAAQRGMKVFFQSVDDVDAVLHPEHGKISSLSLEELRLTSGVFLAMTTALLSSNYMLPGSGRTFREWQVGILNRFDRPE